MLPPTMMGEIPTGVLVLAGATLVAAIVNGALGYGFSSLTVPVALLFYTNRVLNPCILVVEVAVNGYVLLVNRRFVPQVWKRVVPIVAGLIPGVILGTFALTRVHPGWLKLLTFVILLPLILLQAMGKRRPIRGERGFGYGFGGGLGVLYSLTTISGPPLALLLNNQGFAKAEFRAALAIVRLAESIFTGVVYYFAGLYTVQSLQLVPWVAPSVLIGVPIGASLIRRLSAETFRRLCMSFDAWAVGFGLSTVVADLRLASRPAAFTICAATIFVDAWLLYRYFSGRGFGGRAPINAQLGQETPHWAAPVTPIGQSVSKFSQ